MRHYKKAVKNGKKKVIETLAVAEMLQGKVHSNTVKAVKVMSTVHV
jgi:hypothetical protein